MNKHLLLAAAAATMFAAPVFAQTVPYTTGAGSFGGVGATPGFPDQTFDQVTFTSEAGVYTGYGTYNLNGVSFLAGINANAGDPTHYTGQLGPLTATIFGTPVNYGVNFAIDIGTVFDTITLGGNSYVFGDTKITFNPLTLSNDGSAPTTGTLTFTAGAVPEPATWAMMVLGFGMVGFGLRSRRKQAVRVTYA